MKTKEIAEHLKRRENDKEKGLENEKAHNVEPLLIGSKYWILPIYQSIAFH